MRTVTALIKPRYHFSFVTVVLGALLFARPIDSPVVVRLTALYLSFNVLLYGGIYTFNDIADRRADARHPLKRARPVASGRIGVGAAAAIASILIVSGVATAAALFPPPILACYAAIVALNAAYSCGGRDRRGLDIALNAAPHAVRLLMGALLTGRVPPPGHLAAWFCLAAAIACVRRLVEKQAGGEAARPVLGSYSTTGLAAVADGGLLLVLALCVADGWSSPGFYSLVVPAYVMFVVVARRLAVGQVGFVRLWLH